MRYLLAIIFLCCVGTANATDTIDTTVTELVITNSDNCVVDNKLVKTYVFDANDDTGKVAVSAISRGDFVVVFDSSAIKKLNPLGAEFIYYHECGHFALGHVTNREAFNNIMTIEHDADCFAVDKFYDKYGSRTLIQTLISLKVVNGTWHKERMKGMLSCLGREYEN